MAALHGIEVEQVTMTPRRPGGNLGLGDRLNVVFKWEAQPGISAPEYGTARYLNSLGSRDVYEINGKVCKFTTLAKANETNIQEMGSARDFRDLVPACHGHFIVNVAGRDVSVLVTALIRETVADLFSRLKEQPLTPALGSCAVEVITAVIATMAWAAGDTMQLSLSDWLPQNLGLESGSVLLIDWEKTSKAPETTPSKRIRGGMRAFMSWLPGFDEPMVTSLSEGVETPLREWLTFLEGCQTHLLHWWIPFQDNRLPTEQHLWTSLTNDLLDILDDDLAGRGRADPAPAPMPPPKLCPFTRSTPQVRPTGTPPSTASSPLPPTPVFSSPVVVAVAGHPAI